MESTILKASINNQIMNVTNILGMLEDLWYLIQSNMKDWVYQVQRILADKLDAYKGKENKYVNSNIQEIQEFYKDEEQTKKKLERERVKNEEVIFIKLYEVHKLVFLTSFS